MTKVQNSKYKVSRLDTLPAGLFGETYVVSVGIKKSEEKYLGEYFVLTQRPSPLLSHGRFHFSTVGVPSELVVVDLDFLVRQSFQQAEVKLIDLLQSRAEQLQRPDLSALPIRLIEIEASPFLGCWIRGHFHDQIRAIADSTECSSLSAYLTAITKVSLVE